MRGRREGQRSKGGHERFLALRRVVAPHPHAAVGAARHQQRVVEVVDEGQAGDRPAGHAGAEPVQHRPRLVVPDPHHAAIVGDGGGGRDRVHEHAGGRGGLVHVNRCEVFRELEGLLTRAAAASHVLFLDPSTGQPLGRVQATVKILGLASVPAVLGEEVVVVVVVPGVAVSRLEKAPREVLAGPREYVGFREDRAERRVHVAVGFLTVGSGPGPAARLGRLGRVRERGRKGGLLHRRRPELARDGRRATHAPPVPRRPLRRGVGVPPSDASHSSSHRARAQRAVRSRARRRNAAHLTSDGSRRPGRVRRQPRVRGRGRRPS
mmetsp:Transcript_2412/g.10348  ORF Transcript_2412/g.10348 Transcript_2412/m.10348 type:complete len:322 (-) Transcript_2412:3381-4346(-)